MSNHTVVGDCGAANVKCKCRVLITGITVGADTAQGKLRVCLVQGTFIHEQAGNDAREVLRREDAHAQQVFSTEGLHRNGNILYTLFPILSGYNNFFDCRRLCMCSMHRDRGQ